MIDSDFKNSFSGYRRFAETGQSLLEFTVLAAITWVILLLLGATISGILGAEAREIVATYRATFPAVDALLLTGFLLYLDLLLVKQLHKRGRELTNSAMRPKNSVA